MSTFLKMFHAILFQLKSRTEKGKKIFAFSYSMCALIVWYCVL